MRQQISENPLTDPWEPPKAPLGEPRERPGAPCQPPSDAPRGSPEPPRREYANGCRESTISALPAEAPCTTGLPQPPPL